MPSYLSKDKGATLLWFCKRMLDGFMQYLNSAISGLPASIIQDYLCWESWIDEVKTKRSIDQR